VERGGGWGYAVQEIQAGRGKINALLNPLQGEVITCLQGVQAAIKLGVGKSTFATVYIINMSNLFVYI
jgi:hypothetical protein